MLPHKFPSNSGLIILRNEGFLRLSFHWFNNSGIWTRSSWIWTCNSWIWTRNSWICTRNSSVWTCNSWIRVCELRIWTRTFEFELLLLRIQHVTRNLWLVTRYLPYHILSSKKLYLFVKNTLNFSDSSFSSISISKFFVLFEVIFLIILLVYNQNLLFLRKFFVVSLLNSGEVIYIVWPGLFLNFINFSFIISFFNKITIFNNLSRNNFFNELIIFSLFKNFIFYYIALLTCYIVLFS